MANVRRLMKELAAVQKNIQDGSLLDVCSMQPTGQVDGPWSVLFLGPEGTPYEAGIYNLTLTFGPNYPFQRPTAVFSDPVPVSCAVNKSGNISCNFMTNWSPGHTLVDLATELRSAIFLRCGYEGMGRPFNTELASLLQKDVEAFVNHIGRHNEEQAKGVVHENFVVEEQCSVATYEARAKAVRGGCAARELPDSLADIVMGYYGGLRAHTGLRNTHLPQLTHDFKEAPPVLHSEYLTIDKDTAINGDPKGFTLFVKTLTGRTVTLNGVLPSFTTYDIKYMTYFREDIPPENQRFIFAGKRMCDEYKMGDFHIQHECTMHLVLRLSGGDLWITDFDSQEERKLDDGEVIGFVMRKQLATLALRAATFREHECATPWDALNLSRLKWEPESQAIATAENAWGSTFSQVADTIIALCRRFSELTRSEWTHVNLQDIHLHGVMNRWCEHVFTDLGLAQHLGVEEKTMASLYGFVLREGIEDQPVSQETFRAQPRGVTVSQSGAVTQIHEDDSDVTIDLCIGTRFAGGALVFSPKDPRNPTLSLPHKLGKLSMFRGDCRHHVIPIESGERVNLILFLKFT